MIPTGFEKDCGGGDSRLYRGSLLDIARCLRLGPPGPGPDAIWPDEAAFALTGVQVTDIAAIAKRIEPEVKSLGYELVRVAMIGGTSDPTLQVMAERPDTRQLALTDCEAISRRLSDWIDAEDPIEGGFRLEVSSPGIDRPLTRLKDYADWAGYEARITLAEPTAGRKQYSGTLEGIDGETVKLTDKSGQAQAFAFADISSAKLLLTDKLINATAPISTEGADSILTTEE